VFLVGWQAALALAFHAAIGRNTLKALDEYNYCRFTKGWTDTN